MLWRDKIKKMDIKIENLIKERMDSLPVEFKAALATIDWAHIVQEIGQKNQIHVDKIGELQTETILLLMGVTHPGDYQAEIERALQLPENGGVGILNDVNERILLPLRKKVMEATGEKEEPIEIATAPEETEEDRLNIEILKRLDRMPDEINKLIGDQTLPTKISNIGESANMSEQELSGLEDLISMVFLGYVHPNQLMDEIKDKFNYPDGKVELVANRINKEIFAPVKEALIKNYEAELAIVVPDNKQNQDNDRYAMLAAIENPPASPSLGGSPIGIAKLRTLEAVRIPKKETDYSLMRNTGEKKEINQPIPAVPEKKIDPYREIPI